MQGVQVAPALNDENSSALAAGAQLSQLKSAAPLAAAKPGSVLKSARKAFGNITNSGQPRGDATAAKPKQSQPLRRAFGDITNSAAKPPAGPTTTAKKATETSSSLFAAAPTVQKAPAAAEPAASSSQSAPAVEQASTSTSQQWEDVEPERPAGKTWEQLEEERWAAIDAEAERSAAEVLRAVQGPGFFSFLAPPVSESDDEAPWLQPPGPVPDLPSTQPEPVPDVSLEDLLSLPSDINLATLLPDIPVPGGEEEEEEKQGQPEVVAGAAGDVGSEGVSGSSTVDEAAAGRSDGSPVRSPASQAAADCRSPDVLPW